MMRAMRRAMGKMQGRVHVYKQAMKVIFWAARRGDDELGGKGIVYKKGI